MTDARHHLDRFFTDLYVFIGSGTSAWLIFTDGSFSYIETWKFEDWLVFAGRVIWFGLGLVLAVLKVRNEWRISRKK